MPNEPYPESNSPAWLTTIASLAVGAAFFALWFWLLPGWLGFDVAAVGPAHSRWIGAVPSVLGFSVALRCIWDFGRTGRGTPAPFVPPQRLVVVGFYRYVRNPMYVGFALMLVGWAVHIAVSFVLVGPVVFILFITRFQIIPEERVLTSKFGGEYRKYQERVRRWL